MTSVKYSNLIVHAGHELEIVDYGETMNLNCKTCNKLIRLFERPEIWTVEEGDGFTAYGKALYTSLPLDQRLGLSWEIINLHHRPDIAEGSRVRILKCDSNPSLVNKVAIAKRCCEAQIAKTHYCGADYWYVDCEGIEVLAQIKPVPTRTQRAAATQVLEALKELLNHVDYEDPTARKAQREAFIAIAAAYGIEV